MAQSLGTATGRIVIDASGVQKGIGKATQGLGLFTKSALGLTGALVGGAGIAAAIKSVVQPAMQFDAQLSILGAKADATRGQMAALSQQALDLGGAAKYSAQEAAVAQTELATAGLTVREILGGGLQSALALAAAGNIDLAEAAAIAANSQKQFKLDARQLPGIADALAVAANKTTAEVSDFGMALSQTGSVAKSSGLGFRETMVYLEALADNAVKGSDAGTSLKSALIALLSPTDKAADAMKQHGLSVLDANGEMVDAATLSGRLQKATEGMTLAQRTAFFNTLVGRDGIRALNAVMDQGPAKLKAYEQGLQKHGAAAEVAARQQDNLAGDVEKLGGSLDTLRIKAGSALTDVLRGATQGLTSLVDSVSDSGDIDGFIQGLVSGVQQGAQAVTPLVQGMGDLAGGIAAVTPGIAALAGQLLPVAATALQVAGALASIGGGLLGLAADFAGTAAGTALLTGALYAGVAAWTAYRAAAIAGLVVQAAQGVGTFLSLARGITSVADGITLVSMAAPRLGAALAALTGPVGMVVAGVSGFAAIVGVLKTGMFSGGSAAQEYAAALDRMRSATDAASGSVQRLNQAVGAVTDARLAQSAAALQVEQAERTLGQAIQQHGRGSLEARMASVSLAQARRGLARANDEVVAKAQEGAVATAKEVTTQQKAVKSTEDMIRRNELEIAIQERLNSGSAEGRRRIQELAAANDGLRHQMQAQTKQAAAASQGFTRVGNAAGSATPKIRATGNAVKNLGDADVNDLQRMQDGIKNGVDAGKAIMDAGASQIRTSAQQVDGPVSLASWIASIGSQINQGVALAQAGAARFRAVIASMNADHRNSPSANDRLRASLDNQRDIIKQGGDRSAKEAKHASELIRDALAIDPKKITARTTLDQALGMGNQEATRLITKARAAAKGQADAVLAVQEELDRQLSRIDAEEERRRLNSERARLEAEQRAARRRLAAAKKDDRADATRDVRTASEALRVFNIQAARDQARKRVETASAYAGRVQALVEQAQQGLDRVGQAVTDAIQRSLAAQVSALEDAFEQASAAAQQRLDQRLAEIDASVEARRATAAEQEAAAIRAARAAQDATDNRGTLSAAADAADVNVRRLEDVQARARTDSERAAAQQLLTVALQERDKAARALAEFDQDARAQALDAEAQYLNQRLEAQRQEAQRVMEVERQQAQASLDQQRAAAEAQAAAQTAALDRQIGDMRERLRLQAEAGKVHAAGFLAELDGIYRAYAPQLAASGETLGLAFSQGLARTRKEVERTARQLAASVAAYLRLRSPAERGPLAEDPADWGATLARDFAAGMAQQRAAVVREAERIAAVAARTTASAAPGAPTTAAGGVTNIQVDARGGTMTPRDIAESLGWHLAHQGRGG